MKNMKLNLLKVLNFDEQYVLVMGEWVYKLTALDPNTGHVFDFCIATHDEFNAEFVYNFLKPFIARNLRFFSNFFINQFITLLCLCADFFHNFFFKNNNPHLKSSLLHLIILIFSKSK